jgi:hypothetical protein
MDVLGMERVSEEAQCDGPLVRTPLLGTPKGILGLLFFEPEVINNLSPGGIWNFGKVTGLP